MVGGLLFVVVGPAGATYLRSVFEMIYGGILKDVLIMSEIRKTLVLGLLAHVDAGKTTLTEGLLYSGGTIKKMGRVDSRDAFLDTEELEKKRGITIFSKQAVIHEDEGDIILMDTPGHVDFSSEMERTLGILDAALLIISGPEGIESHTRTLWSLLLSHKIPVFVFVNKMDQATADKERVLEEIRGSFGDHCIDFTDYVEASAPENVEGRLGDSRPAVEGECCSESSLGNFYENLATCSEELLEEYLEKDKISHDLLFKNIESRVVIPIFFGSALKDSGVDSLYAFVLEYMSVLRDTCNLEAKLPESGTASGIVYKIGFDEKKTRLTYIKITSGSMANRDSITYSCGRSGDLCETSEAEPGPLGDETGETLTEKVTGIRLYSGAGYESLPRADKGMVVALTGLSRTYAGQGIGDCEDLLPPSLAPALSYRMILPEGCDPVTVLPMIRILAQEDPQLHLNWNGYKKEISLGLMGEIQTQIIKSVIEERFGIKVSFSPGSIIYKETINNTVEGVGHFEPLRHYAEVHLLLEPGERGSGIQLENECDSDQLSWNYQKLIMTHLGERAHRGILTGSVITDIKITLKSGKSHLKHTEGGDFRQATYRAVRQGLMQAEHTLLEPYYRFTLSVPENYIGRAMTDLDNRHCTFVPGEIADGFSVISGRGPVSCLQSYARNVLEYTAGLGKLELSFGGYDKCHNSEEVVAETMYDPEEDMRNPSYSVFCTHGAGFPVPWYEVFDYMHLPSVLSGDGELGDEGYSDKLMAGKLAAIAEKERHYIREEDRFIGADEVDRIINEASGANRNASGGQGKGIPKKSRQNRRTTYAKEWNYNRESRALAAEPKLEYLLVDGYNIIFAWQDLKELAEESIDGARGRLADILSNYRGLSGCEILLVFDAYRVKNHIEETVKFNNICIVYTGEAETADAYIEKFAHKNSSKYNITVATSDGLEQIIIRGAGAELLSASDLRDDVERAVRDAMENHGSHRGNKKIFLGESFPPDFKI